MMFDKKKKKQFEQILPGKVHGIRVVEGDVNSALRSWKKMLKDNDIVNEVYNRSEYLKPSEKRRKAKSYAKYKETLSNGRNR